MCCEYRPHARCKDYLLTQHQQDCFGSNFGSCGQFDFACICGNQTLIGGLSCCVYQTCNPEEQESQSIAPRTLTRLLTSSFSYHRHRSRLV